MSNENDPVADAPEEKVADEPQSEQSDSSELRVPSLLSNYVSMSGMVLVIASLASIILLFLLELTSATDQPYLGVLIYVLLPSAMVFGLFVVLVGVILERRRRRKLTPEQIAAYPILDLNGPRRRRAFLTFVFCSFIFLMMSAFGSYRAFEFTESVEFCGELCHSVMRPEFVAYQASPHSQVKCVECHVGSGAGNYLRAKFNGVNQLIGVTFGTYEKPIKSPVHNMRSANETCVKCHWTEIYHGDVYRVFNHYLYDETSSLNQTKLLVKVGGGSAKTGRADGIHWHMNLQKEVLFIAGDERRQTIKWVRMTDNDGSVTEYFGEGAHLTPDEIAKSEKRRMDCIDCHNRPTHIYLSPDQAVDKSIDAQRLDVSLPFLKLKAVEVLAGDYDTTEQAMSTIATNFPAYYQANYPQIYSEKKAAIDAAATELQRIYGTYFFPEMKTDWRAHPNNIGHRTSMGCFRCHDGKMATKEGRVIRNECNICHTTIQQSFGGRTFSPEDGKFQHPVNLGDYADYKCAACHQGNRPFQHPLKLGDISKFQCSECHKDQTYRVKNQ